MRRREQSQATEASSPADRALTERWYEVRNLVDSLRAREARIAELAARLAASAPRTSSDRG